MIPRNQHSIKHPLMFLVHPKVWELQELSKNLKIMMIQHIYLFQGDIIVFFEHWKFLYESIYPGNSKGEIFPFQNGGYQVLKYIWHVLSLNTASNQMPCILYREQQLPIHWLGSSIPYIWATWLTHLCIQFPSNFILWENGMFSKFITSVWSFIRNRLPDSTNCRFRTLFYSFSVQLQKRWFFR